MSSDTQNTEASEELKLIEGLDPVLDLTSGIASAFLNQNRLAVSEVPELLRTIHSTLTDLGKGIGVAPAASSEVVVEAKTPAEIKKSIKPEHLISFIDGKQYKTLKRHLTKHGFTFEQYREKFGLPADYPSVSSDYSKQRSQLAKTLGLGQNRGGAEKAAA